jgi:anti-sigma B factor antagonist
MLRLTTQNLGDVMVYRLAGRITAGDSDGLRNAVCNERDARVVVLDLADVTAVDAAGLGMLISLRTWAKNSGAKLKLMNVTPKVEEVLELTKLKSAFEICSVHDMMDLLCRAVAPARLAVTASASRCA